MQNMPWMNPMMMQQMMGVMGGGDDEWMKGFELGLKSVNDTTPVESVQEGGSGPKINIIFKTTKGVQHNLILNMSTTVDAALALYLKRVGKPELINNIENKICFLYNAAQLKFGDNTPVGQFFGNSPAPKVLVNDVNNLIGA